MSQNLEKYFGFNVEIDDAVDPAEDDLLKEIAVDLERIHKIDTEKYLVHLSPSQVAPQA